MEISDGAQGFLLHHSIAGGTGSGLAALILEQLSIDYGKQAKISFPIYPQPHEDLSLYNSVLSTPALNDHTDMSIVVQN